MSDMQTSGSIGQSGTSLQDKKNDTDPKSKISSINYANNRNLSYSMSKSLATIGKGELIVGDKDISSLSKDELASLQSNPNNKALYNSDDLTRLNRDSSKLSKELYSTKLNSNVDASVDMRLFSEGGRKEIKDELNRGSAIYEAINLIATTENAKASKIFDYIGGFTSGYDKDSISLAANLDVLDDPRADIFKKQRAAQDIANQIGVKVKFANLNRGSGGKFNSDDPNSIYINTMHISSAKEFMTSLQHELVHRSDNKRGAFIPKDPAQNQFATNYALGMLSMSEKALRLNGRSLNDYSPKVNPNDKTVIADTKYFYSLDQGKSDDFVVAVPYIAAGALAISSAIYTKYALEKIREENDISNRPVRLRQPSVPEIKYSEENQQSQDSNQNAGQNNQVQAPAPAPLPPEDDDEGNIIKKDSDRNNYVNQEKKKASNSQVGDTIRTPESHPNDFIKKGKNYMNRHTKEIWQKSTSSHYKADISDTEWKVGIKKNVEPSTNKKITVDKNGKIIKFDK